MKQPNFDVGVSQSIVENMINEVLDSMVFAGEIKADEIGDFEPNSDVMDELQTLIAAHLNKRMSNKSS